MSRDTWQFINTFAPWLSAIGTLAVVIVSLYLASTKSRIKLRITAGHRLLAGMGTGELPEYLMIEIVNTGFRQARITGVGWKVGLFNKRYAVQVLDDNLYSRHPPPVSLTNSQEVRYLIPLRDTADWLNEFSKDFVGKPPRIMVHTLKLQVDTSLGKTFERKVEKSLRKKIVEAATKEDDVP